MRYRMSAIKCAERYGIRKAAVKCHTFPSSIYRWKEMLAKGNGDIRSNGAEFTKQFLAKSENNHSMFEATAKRLNIRLKRIKPHTPKHNGKVERSHREDQKLFYSEMVRLSHLITDIEEFKRRLKRHQHKTNNRPTRPLGYLSPVEYMKQYKNKKLKR